MAQKAGGVMQPEQQGAMRQSTFPGSPIGLIGVRATWVAISVCLLTLISTSLPAAYAHLQAPCRNPTCDVGQITVDNVIALHRLGLPVAEYALYPLLTSLLTGGILFLVSFVIFWRRSDQWFPFFYVCLLVGDDMHDALAQPFAVLPSS